MVSYVALLRGINVGGHKIIKMEDLNEAFLSLGFKNVKTYIQTGNVTFDSAEKNTKSLTGKITKTLDKLLGYEVTVFLRTIDEIKEIVEADPFKGGRPGSDLKPYVTFLSDSPSKMPGLPMFSTHKEIEVFLIKNREAYSFCGRYNGRSGFPNNFIEKQLGVLATTRNWNTVSKLAK